MYRLFSKIPRGSDPDAVIFKQHVSVKGKPSAKQAEDAASNKKVGVNDEALKRHWRRCVSCALQYCFVIYIVKHIEDMIEVLFTFAGGKTASLY
ncbi:Hypothetical predicted protein [Olea europaea subsp. europaea]|uniref:Uncharacterized protein n=1 Tax=Olea europaea subsp. europaea TaxID=158383 RepID=A0A8S0R745_OLEEU|nr:Hypothetical predicted protein [Olea europaea subsp. europaea]